MLDPNIIEVKIPKFAKKLSDIHFPNDWKIVMKNTAKMMVNLADGKKLTDSDLNQIKHEILLGIGELDKMVTIEESENAVNQLANGKLCIIQGFQHPIERVDTNQLAKTITDFLSKR